MLDAIAKKHHVSATQVATYMLCPRKWGWGKLNGIVAPPNRFAEKGVRVHRIAASWLGQGLPIDLGTEEGKIFKAGLKFLPAPGVQVEQEFRFTTEIATYFGLWDVIVPVSTKDPLVSPIPIVSIFDHKTTTDLKWAKNVSDLRQDPQAILYAVAAVAGAYQHQKTDDLAPGVCLNWVYYRASARKPGARLTQLYVLPDDVFHPARGQCGEFLGVMDFSELEDKFASIEQVAAKLLEHRRQGHKAEDLEYDLGGCSAFGGCPYKGSPCRLTLKQAIGGYMAQEQKKTDVVSRLRRGEKVGQAPVEASTPEMTADMQSKAFGFNVAARLAETRAPNAKAQASPEVVARADEAVQHAVEQSGLFNPPGEEAAEEPIPEVVEEATETPAGAPSSSRKRGRPPKTSQALEPVALDTHRLMAGRISVGLIRARLFNPTDPGYIDRIAHLSVEIAEKIDQILMSK